MYNYYSISVYSFIEAVEHLFTVPGIKSFLSERVQQDPIEKYFGRQRQRGRVNENPSVYEFLKNEQALRVINSIDLEVTLGNTRGTNKRSISDETLDRPLSKRRKQRSKGALHACNYQSSSKLFFFVQNKLPSFPRPATPSAIHLILQQNKQLVSKTKGISS